MNPLHLQIFSTLLGFAGTLIMFFYSHNLKPYEGGVFGSREVTKWNEQVKKDNKRIAVMQKIGLGLLTSSFLCQSISYLF